MSAARTGGSIDMRRTNVIIWCLFLRLVAILAIRRLLPRQPRGRQGARSATQNADEWLTNGRDYTEQRYSPLREIDASNVSKLGLAWYYDTGSDRTVETTPIVSNGVMYATLPWSVVVALDARTGTEKWR